MTEHHIILKEINVTSFSLFKSIRPVCWLPYVESVTPFALHSFVRLCGYSCWSPYDRSFVSSFVRPFDSLFVRRSRVSFLCLALLRALRASFFSFEKTVRSSMSQG